VKTLKETTAKHGTNVASYAMLIGVYVFGRSLF